MTRPQRGAGAVLLLGAGLCLVPCGGAVAHDLPPEVLQRFVTVIREAGCSMSIAEIDRDLPGKGFAPDDLWHAVTELLNEGRATVEGGRDLILTEEECA